jgi:cell division protease FtsH
VTFKDVAGVDEAKRELEEVVDFLKRPKKYRALGARTPKGVLLIGPAGVGKTLLAKAVAGEAGVPFFSMAGSEFMEMLVGVGASRVRDLFNTAKKAAPAIIFIDELDAIGRVRGMAGSVGGHDEREQTLNQILVEMDGFTPNDNVIVLAATNRPDVLDPALVRPGRFDRRVSLDMPDIEGRKAILAIHAKGKPFDKGLDWNRVAKRTVGFSGADLENVLNEAAIQAARSAKKAISAKDIEEAATKVKLGPEKRRLQSDLERKMTAYHEAGHAVVGHMLPGADPVHRVSIVSRLMSLGQTLALPERDKYQQTKSELIDMMAMMLGGRAAERLVFKELTAGAANDIEKVTRVARKMVVDFGMSDLGPVALGPMWETSEWGRSFVEPDQVSEEMKAKIDKEVKRLVDDAMKTAEAVLRKNMKKVDKLVEVLLAQETVEGEEFEKIMGVKKASNE